MIYAWMTGGSAKVARGLGVLVDPGMVELVCSCAYTTRCVRYNVDDGASFEEGTGPAEAVSDPTGAFWMRLMERI